MKHLLLQSIAVAALAACSSTAAPERDATSPAPTTQSAARADTLSVRLGQTASADAGRLSLKFEARVADSRCPANVVCVWAGDAHVRITTRVGTGAAATADLHSNGVPNKLVVDRYTITMVGMTPYPGTGNDNDTPVLIVRITSE